MSDRDAIRNMHVLVKWNPRRDSNTLDKHRRVAESGSTWWGCDSDSPSRSTAKPRIDRLNGQIQRNQPVWTFIYRTGDSPSAADVWRATTEWITDRLQDVDESQRPAGYTLDGSFLWLKLRDFVRVEPGWVVANLELFTGRQLTSQALKSQQSPIFVSIRDEAIEDPQTGDLYEGALKRSQATRYERNRGARRACITHWGTRCTVCRIDLGERYGALGEGAIHVHHLRELSTLGVSYRVDPIADLRPICPNCHFMVHRAQPALSMEELRALLIS